MLVAATAGDVRTAVTSRAPRGLRITRTARPPYDCGWASAAVR